MHRSIILWSIYRNIHYHTMNHCPLGNLFTSFASRRVDVSHRTSIKPTKVESSELTSESASCGEETQGECELPDWIRLDRWYKMQKEFKKLTCLSMAKGLSCQSCTDMSMATSPFFLGCGIVLGILFFFFVFFFFWVGGGFGAVQAPFWENPGVKGRFVRVFQDIWGWF